MACPPGYREPNKTDGIRAAVGTGTGGPKAVPTLFRVINQFKGSITKQIGFPIWQPRFYGRIIRNEREYREIWQYIEYNPLNWLEDGYYT